MEEKKIVTKSRSQNRQRNFIPAVKNRVGLQLLKSTVYLSLFCFFSRYSGGPPPTSRPSQNNGFSMMNNPGGGSGSGSGNGFGNSMYDRSISTFDSSSQQVPQPRNQNGGVLLKFWVFRPRTMVYFGEKSAKITVFLADFSPKLTIVQPKCVSWRSNQE